MDFTPTDDSPLFGLESAETVLGLDILDEAVGLFDRDLGQFPVLVEDVKKITFRDTFSW